MSAAIVLAMHGAPPSDFPRQEVGEFFALQGRLKRGQPEERAALQARHDEIEAKMRAWPRRDGTDAYWAGSQALAEALRQATELTVLVGFHEFCAPSIDEVLDEAVRLAPEKVVVVTPMLTRGGEHSEQDIPAAIERARVRCPQATFEYAWPYAPEEMAAFFAAHIRPLVERTGLA